jgi:Effector-associated domain 7
MNYSLYKIRVLIDGAFRDEDLKIICFDHFYQIYNDFTAGQNKSDRIITLVDHAHRQGQISILLGIVKCKNPHAYQEYINQIDTLHNRSQFPEISNFDLKNPIDQCLSEIIDRQGLIGLSICCTDNLFIKSFCERLKLALRRRNTQIRQSISLNPQLISVDRAVKTIQQYQNILNNNDIICPIRVNVNSSNTTIIKDFWAQINDAFQGKFNHRLIIIIISDRDCLFPSDITLLNPPQFDRVHVFEWIGDMTLALRNMQSIEEWIEVGEIWRKIMIKRCHCELQNSLDVGLVYEHLDFTLSLLQKNPSLSPQDFLQYLE